MLLEKGYVQVYTGDGKGKTTASMGLAMRCVGSGGRVFVGQFLKGRDSAERESLAKLGVRVEHFGGIGFIAGEPSESDYAAAREAFTRIREAALSGDYDLVVLDELNTVLFFGLIPVEEVLALIRQKPAHTELVLTGRRAPEEIVEAADLVTEMRAVKHYYDQGVPARLGIEE
ncbi:MAG: cob(I)yrinic acid a,c-diamide adenosyltransferase [Clostridiales Family XIII bacterium]|jgi:cob(I)alamin adenosyltransferase|nr:cob(I)yrinic acid a,c-diamide adenosyltransferase [Clostridiales Family XIII bacterium]